MKPENLKIGNFVIPKQGNFILNNMEFTNNDYPKLTRQGMIDLINSHIEVEPVPLTKYWLYKFGFKECTGDEYNNGRPYFKTSDYTRIYDFTNDGDGFRLHFSVYSNIGVRIEYVHQLQNILFYFIGELEIINS